ncbi:nitrate reductase molybdenum cofactor assembly chaperone [Edwardsiella hoshinae]|uniref:Redox enzyme maturation protein NarJ n=1 Tax=Edwardsiella hoshinae TaxID=93378 RepID=A0A376DM79_9GAMM|nr:nitrate reductase molybdenum cofactor assembly chaperone [Edwardsiella hoshinae]QPR28917.1 nitrate reductase molybdenum cofactor assembly chaperone [Edwardsiella hoshinae]STC91828.1 Redox enzyme maturation protein NarJ [Edwardsiella hoshinae]
MLSLLIVARLLEYPDEALWQARDELACALTQCPELSEADRALLADFIHHYYLAPLTERQSEYVAQFDHTRRCALYLCEHQLAESKNRGQAMVNILQHYQQAALIPAVRELPDYLPMVLEFAYLQDQHAPGEGHRILTQIADVAQILYQRTKTGRYGALFLLLLHLAGRQAETREELAPAPDIDAEWERAHAPARVELPALPHEHATTVHYLNLGR